MAARRPMLVRALVAAAAAWLVYSAAAPAFVGTAPRGRAPRVAVAGSRELATTNLESCEIMVTIPAIGARTRLIVSKDKTIDAVVADARKIMGFDMEFLETKDWKAYRIGEEEGGSPLAGSSTMVQNDLMKLWSPAGTELHLVYDP